MTSSASFRNTSGVVLSCIQRTSICARFSSLKNSSKNFLLFSLSRVRVSTSTVLLLTLSITYTLRLVSLGFAWFGLVVGSLLVSVGSVSSLLVSVSSFWFLLFSVGSWLDAFQIRQLGLFLFHFGAPTLIPFSI